MLEEEFLEAVARGDTQAVVRLLGQTTGSDNCSVPNKNGQNALHIACQFGNADIVSVLLLSGLYDCNICDAAGYSPLQIAAAEGHVEIVKLLIKSKANINSADKVHGNTALHEASWKGYSKTVTQLAKANADLNIKNWGGFTALHLCCQKGHNQSCRELLLAGRNQTDRELCDPNIQNNYGDTPLHTSARYGHAGVLRILISAECHISDQNKNGDTALHIAAAMNHRKLTRILLECGCDKTILNKQHETAEGIAARKSLVQIVEILRNTKINLKKKCLKDEEDTPKKSKKSSKTKHKVKADGKKIATPNTAAPWSPYGCHYYPDASDFPDPKLDTLPNEPLQKGEQYYLDLAGNIRKGPVGVGYTCYCAPFFRKLENHLDKRTSQLKKRINQAEENINSRLKNVEQTLNIKSSNDESGPNCDITNNHCTSDFDPKVTPYLAHRTRSLEYVFDENGHKVKSREDNIDKRCLGGRNAKHDIDRCRDILYDLQKCNINGSALKNNYSNINFRLSHRKFCQDLNNSECNNLYSLYNINNEEYSLDSQHSELTEKPKLDVWRKSALRDDESCISSVEDCEPVIDIQCNDSGYSTKMCSNSQGPSPSLSGRLVNDGLLSIEKHMAVEPVSYKEPYKNVSIPEASIV